MASFAATTIRFVLVMILWCVASIPARAQVPSLLNYQGFVTVAGAGFDGAGQFNFALVDPAGSTTYWSNDGTSVGGSQPSGAVTLAVASGVFNVVLGDVSLVHMTAIPPAVFTGNGDVRLRVWFNDGTHGAQVLSPDQRVVAVGYAIRAASADALAATATVAGSQIIGTVATTQLADGSVTKPKLSASGGSGGQVLGTDGTNLAWKDAGTVTSVVAGAGLTGGTITGSGTLAVDPTSATLTGNFFRRGGNAFGATAQLGTTDGNAVQILVNGTRVVGYFADATSPIIVGGNATNNVTVGASGAFIGGGGGAGTSVASYDCGGSCVNRVTDQFGTIGGGAANLAGNAIAPATDSIFATVSGGLHNIADSFSSVGGGSGNAAHSTSVVSGGINNTATFESTVGGGEGNSASANSTVGGGFKNSASALYATVAGGIGNSATNAWATVGGGGSNAAAGYASTVPGGDSNSAAGDYSITLGARAITTATGIGSFVFSDSSGTGTFGSGKAGEFLVGATGGIGMFTQKDYLTGCKIAAGSGTWSCSSSRDIKRDFEPVDADAVLASVVGLPVTSWRYRTEAEARHLGPMAQDFRAAFGLGSDDVSIATIDAEGVALAAIQGLDRKVEQRDAAMAELMREKDAKIDAQQRRIFAQETALAGIAARLQEMEALRADIVALRAALTTLQHQRTGYITTIK